MPCFYPSPFICQTSPSTLRGQTRLRLNYTKEELTFPSFHVWYRYQAASQQLLDSWQDKRMTGFNLSWFIEDANGTKVTERMPGRPGDWKTKATEARYQDDGLGKMVELARQARVGNITREMVMDRVVTDFSQCKDGQ